MPTQLAAQAQPAVANLLKQDPDQLYAELGKRLHMMQTDASLAGSFAPAAPAGAMMGLAPMDTLRTFGKTFFDRLSVQAYNLLCGDDAGTAAQRGDILAAFGSGSAGVGALLATLLVAQLGLAPAVAGVVAALVIKLFFKPAYEATCAAWKAGLPDAGPAPKPATAHPGG